MTNNFQKEYFVFTDSKSLSCKNDSRVHIIPQKDEGWPFNTLLRFHFFDKISQSLESFDFTFFFNANMIFNDFVNDSFLPQKNQLLVVKHPGILVSDRNNFPYESNKLSTAFIDDDKGVFYFMGGVNGGGSLVFNQLISDLKKNIDLDLSNNIIAKWHDESHLNHYMLNADYKILSDDHVFIEHNYNNKVPKIIIRDKNIFGGHKYLRKIKSNLFTESKMIIKGLIKRIRLRWG